MTLEADARDVTTGCVVLQTKPDDFVKPAGYWSWSHNDTNQKYDMTQCKCFAIVSPVSVSIFYLKRSGLASWTKQFSFLMWILALCGSSSKLAHWRLWVGKRKIDVIYRAVIKQHASDALSSLHSTCTDAA